jgi:hypothetical protein
MVVINVVGFVAVLTGVRSRHGFDPPARYLGENQTTPSAFRRSRSPAVMPSNSP